jgi:hypothetical protein
VHDKDLCDGLSGWETCGDYQVIHQSFIDDGKVYFYQDDQLVAVEHIGVFGRLCAGGPQAFDAPSCSSGSETMPQCRATAL